MSRQPYIVRSVEQRDAIAALVGKLDPEKVWAVTVEPYKKKRSLNQNALYWRWVSIIARETGNSHDDVHEALKAKFCPPRTVALGDEERQIRSTAKLTTEAMNEYMDQVHAFATSELAILLPLPEEQHLAA